jgi:hypothetical protein
VWDHDIGKDEPMGFAAFDLLKVRTPKMCRFLTLDFCFDVLNAGESTDFPSNQILDPDF